jgi:oxygen-dependent protoporphyrinogen oxidase
MMHGIYAGDVWQLSAATILPRLWAIDGESDSLTLELLLKDYKVTVAEAHYLSNAWNSMDLSGNEGMILREMWLQSGVFTLQGGLEQLTKALEVALRLTGSVKFSMERAVEAIEFCAQAKQVEVSTNHHPVQAMSSQKHESAASLRLNFVKVHINGEAPQSHDRVISTISAPALSKIANLPTLSDIPSVTVGLVNLFYSDNQLQNRQGFGYLIPNCPSVPNPTSALGVIFDSCVVPDAASGTKLTVMLGGHLWDSQYPEGADLSREALFDLAKRTVATQLGITATPTLWDATLQKNCIPQYTVGFNQRMAQAHEELKSKYCGLLSVAGSSFNGVGVNDCIYAARIAAALLLSNKHFTGLEKYTYEDEWVPRPKLEF